MAWVPENIGFFQYLTFNILKSGRVPKHLAVIMDGNRRYAKKIGKERNEGHLEGFKKIGDIINWCLLLGIRELTTYAFSIDNFKRTEEEVTDFMNIVCRRKFQKLLEEREHLKENGICMRFIGNLGLVPDDIHEAMDELARSTKDNDRIVINIAFSYTSRDEITNAVKAVVKGVKNGEIKVTDIDKNLITRCLYTYKSEDPDLLIRTSGETRFSDFLMWQTTHTCLYFTRVLWPEFSAWDLISAVFYYQRCYDGLSKAREDCRKGESSALNGRARGFLKKLYEERDSFMDKKDEGVVRTNGVAKKNGKCVSLADAGLKK